MSKRWVLVSGHQGEDLECIVQLDRLELGGGGSRASRGNHPGACLALGAHGLGAVVMTAEELHRRLRTVETLISVPATRADDQGQYRENLECARIAVAYLIRDLAGRSA